MSDDDTPICAWCHGRVVDGAPRVRFFSLVYHLVCWDARIDVTANRMRKAPKGADDA